MEATVAADAPHNQGEQAEARAAVCALREALLNQGLHVPLLNDG
jgi:hypothetical protein